MDFTERTYFLVCRPFPDGAVEQLIFTDLADSLARLASSPGVAKR